MIHRLSRRLAYFFYKKNMVSREMLAVSAYGYELLIAETISWAITILIALLTGLFWESVVYMAVFLVMRQYAGGYHARTHFHCIVISTVVYIVCLALIVGVPHSFYRIVIPIGLFIGAIGIWNHAPVDDPNKPFSDDQERVKFRQRSLAATAVLMIFALASIYFELASKWGFCIMLAILTTGISLMITKRNAGNRLLEKKEGGNSE